jgi:hypothetical protein
MLPEITQNSSNFFSITSIHMFMNKNVGLNLNSSLFRPFLHRWQKPTGNRGLVGIMMTLLAPECGVPFTTGIFWVRHGGAWLVAMDQWIKKH